MAILIKHKLQCGQALIAVLLLLFAGCYDPEETEPSENFTLVDVYSSFCRWFARCHPEGMVWFSGSSVESCTAFHRCELVFRQRWDPAYNPFEDSKACKTFIDHASCDDEALLEIPPGISVNSAVTSSFLFHPSSPCRGEPYQYESRERIPKGEPCIAKANPCAEGLYCRAATPLKMAGANPCGVCADLEPVGKSCSGNRICEVVAYCGDGFCKRKQQLGAPCTDAWECRSEFCYGGSCSETYYSEGKHYGEPCDELGNGEWCDRMEGLRCKNGICRYRPDNGESCEGYDECRLNLVCYEGTCRESSCEVSAGKPCIGNGPVCESGTYCDMETATCQEQEESRLPGTGETCFNNRCSGGHYCHRANMEYVCKPLRAYGEGCWEHRQCESRYCDYSFSDYCRMIDPYGSVCQFPGTYEDIGICTTEPDVSFCD